MVRLWAALAAALLLACGGTGSEVVLTDDPEGQKLPNIAALIKDLNLCFLEPGGPMTPLKLHVPLVGDIEIWKLCCKDSTIAGLNLTMQAIDPDIMWAGDTSFVARLRELSTSCVADWSLNDWKGQATMGLGTAGGGTTKPFIEFGVTLDGEPLSAAGQQFPWPGKVTKTTCAVDFELSDIVFSGNMPAWIRAILNAGASMAELFQGLLRPLVCPTVKTMVPSVLNKVLSQVREAAEPYIQVIAPDADPPDKPEGAGETYDLRTVKPMNFVTNLARQGLETNGINQLVRQVTAGKDSVKVPLGKDGMQVVKLNVSVPADLDLGIWVVNAGLEGVGTIEQLNIAPDDDKTLAIDLSQKHLNVSTKIRTRTSTKTGAAGGAFALLLESFVEDDVARNLTRVLAGAAEYLVENFELRLRLSDVRLNANAGVLWDVNQSTYLQPSSSWYSANCMPTMIQNMSVTHMDLGVVVTEFRFDSDVAQPDQLEKEFDNAVNSILGYLNTPQMRPTVSRLVQSVAAGTGRDIGNQVIQTVLSTPPATPCVAENGFGTWTGFAVLIAIGFLFLVAAFGSLITWLWSKRLGKIGRRFSALLAAAGFFLLPGATLGWPFGAVIRFHNGELPGGWASQDFLLNLYVLEVMDLIKYMPGTVAVIAISTLMWGSRMMAVMGLAVWNPQRARLAKFVRVMGALAGWDLGMMYMLCVTQVVSFYAKILQFGDVWLDMGVALRPAFYVLPVCFFFSDVASIIVYKSCKASKFDLVKYEEPPNRTVLVCLFISLMVLVLSPGFTLWTHNYGGVVGNVIHFQNGGVARPVSLWSVLENAPLWLADPAELGIGVYIIMILITINMILAPIVNAALSLYVGVRLRQHGPDHFHSRHSRWANFCISPPQLGCPDAVTREPRGSCAEGFSRSQTLMSANSAGNDTGRPASNFSAQPAMARGQTQQSFESGPACTDGAALGAGGMDIQRGITEASSFESAEAGAAGGRQGCHRIDRLAWTLVVARMWSGADAFAVYMAIIVPELGKQLWFMSIKTCDPLQSALDQVKVDCNTMTSELNVGLLVLFLAAFSSRILSELAAHGPLRGLPTWEKREVLLSDAGSAPEPVP